MVGIEHTLGGGSNRKVPGIKLSAEIPYFPSGVCDTLAEAMPPGGCWACETTCQIGCELFCTTQFELNGIVLELDAGRHAAGDDAVGNDAVGNDAVGDDGVGNDAVGDDGGVHRPCDDGRSDLAAHERADFSADLAAHRRAHRTAYA